MLEGPFDSCSSNIYKIIPSDLKGQILVLVMSYPPFPTVEQMKTMSAKKLKFGVEARTLATKKIHILAAMVKHTAPGQHSVFLDADRLMEEVPYTLIDDVMADMKLLLKTLCPAYHLTFDKGVIMSWE